MTAVKTADVVMSESRSSPRVTQDPEVEDGEDDRGDEIAHERRDRHANPQKDDVEDEHGRHAGHAKAHEQDGDEGEDALELLRADLVGAEGGEPDEERERQKIDRGAPALRVLAGEQPAEKQDRDERDEE